MSWKTIIVKFSGEDCGNDHECIHVASIDIIAAEICDAVNAGVRVGVVVGAGNIFRGKSVTGTTLRRTTADEMGMLGTLMNALAIRDAVEARGKKAIVFSAGFVEGQATFSSHASQEALDAGYVCIFGGGSGSEFFSTDTTAVLRGLQIGADIVLKATHVDGIYDRDPQQDPQAQRFVSISYEEAIQKKLKIMDLTAFALAAEYTMPIGVYQHASGALGALATGKKEVGTIVHP